MEIPLVARWQMRRFMRKIEAKSVGSSPRRVTARTSLATRHILSSQTFDESLTSNLWRL